MIPRSEYGNFISEQKAMCSANIQYFEINMFDVSFLQLCDTNNNIKVYQIVLIIHFVHTLFDLLIITKDHEQIMGEMRGV